MPLACDPVRQCSGVGGQVLAIDEDGVWLHLGNTVFPGGPVGAVNQSLVQKGAQIPILQANEGVFLPRRDGAGFYLQLVRGVTGTVRSATREFVVSTPAEQDPFRVRFDRLAE